MKRVRDDGIGGGGGERDDLLSLLLVKWVLSDLVNFMRLVMKLLARRGEELEESLFVDETLIRVSEERELTLMVYAEEVLRNAEGFLLHLKSLQPLDPKENNSSCGKEEERVKEEFSLMLRAIFLILFLYDLRVQRFVMTSHNLHTRRFFSRPPGRRKANLFMDSIKPLIDQYLSTSTSLMEMASLCLKKWSMDFMFQSYPEIPYSYSGRILQSVNDGGGGGGDDDEKKITKKRKMEEEDIIPHNDHQQKWWTLVHRDFDFSLTGEYLGF